MNKLLVFLSLLLLIAACVYAVEVDVNVHVSSGAKHHGSKLESLRTPTNEPAPIEKTNKSDKVEPLSVPDIVNPAQTINGKPLVGAGAKPSEDSEAVFARYATQLKAEDELQKKEDPSYSKLKNVADEYNIGANDVEDDEDDNDDGEDGEETEVDLDDDDDKKPETELDEAISINSQQNKAEVDEAEVDEAEVDEAEVDEAELDDAEDESEYDVAADRPPTTPTTPTTPADKPAKPAAKPEKPKDKPTKPKPAKPEKPKFPNTSKCKQLRGECNNKCSKGGTMISGLCTGSASVRCCVPKGAKPKFGTKGHNCGAYKFQRPFVVRGNGGVKIKAVKILKEHLSSPGSYFSSPSASDNSISLGTVCAWNRMYTAAKKAGIRLTINSGFRTLRRQQYFWNCYITKRCNGGNLAARPGTSNHGRGIALDLNVGSTGTSTYRWLSRNARKYGFIRTVPSEAWHWEKRY
jgi:hypothetical protein